MSFREPAPSAPVLPLYAPPRWVTWYINGLWFLLRSVPLAVVFVILWAFSAFGNANTIPERRAELCEFLGYQSGCRLKFEVGKYGTAELEMTVDEHTGDPDGPTSPGTVAGTMRVAINNVNGIYQEAPQIVSQTFQRVVVDAAWGWWWMSITAPPCMTPAQRRLADADESGGYSCLTEDQLAGDPANVAGMLPWARGDWPTLNAIRSIHGAYGVPVPVNTLYAPDVTDERASVRPTSFRVGIVYGFAVPAPGWIPPNESALTPPIPLGD